MVEDMNKINQKNQIKTKIGVAKSDAIQTTVDKLNNCYFSRLIVLSDVINRYIDVTLKNEVNWVRMRAIIGLITIGKGVMTASELARHLMRPAQNITTLVGDLEKDGLIIKRRARKDRRNITIKVTNAGLSYLEQSLEKIASPDKEFRYCLEDDELEIIASLARKTVRHFVKRYADFNNNVKPNSS